jgi:hypothetical protein
LSGFSWSFFLGFSSKIPLFSPFSLPSFSSFFLPPFSLPPRGCLHPVFIRPETAPGSGNGQQ